MGVAAGLGKEGADALGAGDPSARDLTWDLAGVAVGTAIAYIVDAWLLPRGWLHRRE